MRPAPVGKRIQPTRGAQKKPDPNFVRLTPQSRRANRRRSMNINSMSQDSSQSSDPGSIIIEETISSTQGNDFSFNLTTIPETQDNAGLVNCPITPTQLKTPRLSLDPEAMRTLLSSTFIDNLPCTPTQEKQARAVQDLLIARRQIQQLHAEMGIIRTDLCAANVSLEIIKEERLHLSQENEKLKVELNELKQKMKKPTPTQVSNLDKLKKENASLKADSQKKDATIIDLKKDLATAKSANSTRPGSTTNIPTQNRFSPLMETTGVTDVGTNTEKREMLYFRGFWNPLSAFFKHPIKHNGRMYVSAEHAYQHSKALHHKNYQAARDILRTPLPGQAKRIASKHIPQCNAEWDKISFKVMEDIQIAKLNQCKLFKEKLLASGSKTLVHNMEDDPKWGFGPNGIGENRMGKILMNVRKELHKPQTAKLPKESAESLPKTSQEINILVVGNSNTRGLAAQLLHRGRNAVGFVYPGMPSIKLRNRLSQINMQKPPTHVVLHTGDIDTRQRAPIVHTLDAIREARNRFPDSKILVNALPVRIANSRLQRDLHTMNHAMNNLCKGLKDTFFVNNSNLKLKDSIHLTKDSVKQAAANICRLVQDL